MERLYLELSCSFWDHLTWSSLTPDTPFSSQLHTVTTLQSKMNAKLNRDFGLAMRTGLPGQFQEDHPPQYISTRSSKHGPVVLNEIVI